MTCVVALVTPGGCYIGGDSISVADDIYTLAATPKVRQIKDILIGFSGSWKAGLQAFRALERNPDIHKFCQTFTTTETGWSLLAIQDRRIYEISEDLAPIEILPGDEVTYGAIGSGTATALGSLYSDSLDARSVRNALEAAEAHVVNVRRPFVIIELSD